MGIQTTPLLYQAEQNATTLSIQFEAGGLFALSNVPATEYQNGMVEATAVLNPSIHLLREQLLACQTPAEIFKTAVQFLQTQLLEISTERQMLIYMLQQLQVEQLSLAHIGQNIGYSQNS